MKKKAFIEYIMLGGILFLAVVTFVATQADEMLARNKLYQLKKIAKDAGRTATTYFGSKAKDDLTANGQTVTVSSKINVSELLANSIIREMSLGEELIGDGDTTTSSNTTVTDTANSTIYKTVFTNTSNNYTLTYTWTDDLLADGVTAGKDGLPDTVLIETSDYYHSTFWYKFLNKDYFVLHAKIYYTLTNKSAGAGPAVPIGLNGCGNDFSDTTGTQTFNFLYETILDSSANSYTLDNTENAGFYGIYNNNDTNTNNQQELAHIKDYIDGKNEFDYSEGDIYAISVEQDDINNDIKQLSSKFPNPSVDDNDQLYMKVVILPCGTTADTLIDPEVLDIKIESTKCSVDSYSYDTYISELTPYIDDDSAVDADGNPIWEDVGNGCDGTNTILQAFKIKFSIVPPATEYDPN